MPIMAISAADEVRDHGPRGGGNRYCERSEAIQIVNSIDERLDRQAGLCPPRYEGCLLGIRAHTGSLSNAR